MKTDHITLGIETSCDETAAALYHSRHGIIASSLFSQTELHKQFGGVVPELASRSQLEKIIPIITHALERAHITLHDVNSIAVTHKPGLPGSLLVGVCVAKALAWAYKKPLIGVNHLEGHAFSACIEHAIPFPHLCLTASGGHTSLYIITDFGSYRPIGITHDDAAGEAFDKIAKLLELPYPGGPIIEQLARAVNFHDFFQYPRATGNTLDFSFSGLKTAVLYDLVKRGAYDIKSKTLLIKDQTLKQQVASSLLVCIADIFIQKLTLALGQYPDIKAVSFVGGVACNRYIKERLSDYCLRHGRTLYVPQPAYCTDNAAMIAFVGNYKAQQGHFNTLELDILK